MGSIFKRVITLGLLGTSTIVSCLFPSAVLALTQQDVARKLATVPVFIISNDQGAYITNRLVGRDENGNQANEVALLYVFFSGQDAEQYVRLEREQNPDFVANVSVGWVELAALYQQARVERDIPLRLLFVPQSEEVTAATQVNTAFASGVPLFVPKYTDEDSYALLPLGDSVNNGEPVVPIFFSQADLDAFFALIEGANPELRARMRADVVSLEGLINQLEDDTDENLNRLWLFPDSEAINYIQQRRQN